VTTLTMDTAVVPPPPPIGDFEDLLSRLVLATGSEPDRDALRAAARCTHPGPDGDLASALVAALDELGLRGEVLRGTVAEAAAAVGPEHPVVVLGGTVVRFEVHDPIEQAYDEAVLERLYKDDLTGLLARRKFDIELSGALDAAARNDETMAMLVLDVDRLKPINDMHGHIVGSRVISDVGALVRAVLQTRRLERALACRLGGDEFGVAVTGISPEDARELAEAIRRAVAETPFVHEAEPLRVRVSGGLSFYPRDGGTALELLRRADEALYRAKGAGGDRITVHAPEADRR